MALKIARVHQKTKIADLFPMKVGGITNKCFALYLFLMTPHLFCPILSCCQVGQFAELYVSQDDPPMRPDGLLKKGGKIMASLVGLGGSGVNLAAQHYEQGQPMLRLRSFTGIT